MNNKTNGFPRHFWVVLVGQDVVVRSLFINMLDLSKMGHVTDSPNE